MRRVTTTLLVLVTTLFAGWHTLACAAPEADAALFLVPPDVEITGQRLFSTALLRPMLLAGKSPSSDQWQQAMDSLALRYACEARPFLELRWTVDSTASPHRLRRIELDEGPRLVMGRLQVEGLAPGWPNPARDLPEALRLEAGVLEERLSVWLERLDEAGLGLAFVRLQSFTLVPQDEERVALDLSFVLGEADTLRPLALVVQGARLTRTGTLEKLSGLKAGQRWNPRRVEEARRRMLATGWFHTVEGPGLCRSPEGLRWHVKVEEAPAYRLDGLAAWLPDSRGGGRWAYHVNVELANLLGTGREVAVLASRPEGWSQDVLVRYREPFVLGLPLSASLGLKQRVQDSTWVEQRLWTEWQWEAGGGLRLVAALEGAALAPDSLNGYLRAGLDASRLMEGRLGVELDRRDDPRNPRLGWQASLLEARMKREARALGHLPARTADRSWRRQSLRVAGWWPLGRMQVVHAVLGAGRLKGHGQPGTEDLMPMGGLAGPRGTREESLRTREWILAQAEWRLLLGPASRLALFRDQLQWQDAAGKGHRSQGQGAAVVLPLRQGQLELQYAVADGSRWREGLLHVRLVTRF